MFKLFAWANKFKLASSISVFSDVPVVAIITGKSLLAFCTLSVIGQNV